ncbi:MAG: sodium:solute symporter family transporter, partial [Bacteroidia bacterium]
YTQLFQMIIIFSGLFLAAFMVVHLLPPDVGLSDALHIAGKMNKLNAIDLKFDINNRYNIWSGLIGGFFLQLSYFGTDQSQVGRYLTGKSVTESRLGLIMNGLVKIPMQFFILLIGTLVFTFYQYQQPPVFFNQVEVEHIRNSPYKAEYQKLETEFSTIHDQKRKQITDLTDALAKKDKEAVDLARIQLHESDKQSNRVKAEAIQLMTKNNPKASTNDGNYIFLYFVTHQLPVGVIGLLIAIIFLASMGSTASGLNSLASATVIDFYKRLFCKDGDEKNYLMASRVATLCWGIFCVIVALFASKVGNLIEVVNILGSLFYGTILGIFLVAFFMKKIGGAAVFYAAIITELIVVAVWLSDAMAFLWLNVVGCLVLLALAWVMQTLIFRKKEKQ